MTRPKTRSPKPKPKPTLDQRIDDFITRADAWRLAPAPDIGVGQALMREQSAIAFALRPTHPDVARMLATGASRMAAQLAAIAAGRAGAVLH